MKPIYIKSPRFSMRSFSWMIAALLLTFQFAAAGQAPSPGYTNYSVLSYYIPGSPPPTINASNFVNVNSFSVSFTQPGQNAQFYEPENTVTYTNLGVMVVNSPATQIGIFGNINFNSVGAGFQYDTLTTNVIPHLEASTFYNSGDIRCDSVIDGNNETTFFGTIFFNLVDVGQCRVWATNIICPGTIDTSEDGFIQLTGQHVDLKNGVLMEEQGLVTSNNVN